MMVCAVAPAREPAMNLSCTLKLPPSLLPRISHLIWSETTDEEQKKGKALRMEEDVWRTQETGHDLVNCKWLFDCFDVQYKDNFDLGFIQLCEESDQA